MKIKKVRKIAEDIMDELDGLDVGCFDGVSEAIDEALEGVSDLFEKIGDEIKEAIQKVKDALK